MCMLSKSPYSFSNTITLQNLGEVAYFGQQMAPYTQASVRQRKHRPSDGVFLIQITNEQTKPPQVQYIWILDRRTSRAVPNKISKLNINTMQRLSITGRSNQILHWKWKYSTYMLNERCHARNRKRSMKQHIQYFNFQSKICWDLGCTTLYNPVISPLFSVCFNIVISYRNSAATFCTVGPQKQEQKQGRQV